MALTKVTSYAPDIWKSLDGLATIYKPLGYNGGLIRHLIKEKLSSELNEYEPRPLDKRVQIVGGVNETKQIIESPNWADHPLVVGPRYVPWEISCNTPCGNIGPKVSGVVIVLFGNRTNGKYFKRLRHANLINVYEIKAQFGFATATYFDDGPIIDKSSYKHISKRNIDSILDKIQSTQYNRIFESKAIPANSQEAYDLAKDWPARPPRMAKWPVIFNLKCTHFRKPSFTFQVTVCNENDNYLAHLTNDVGILLKSSATVKSMRRIKCGPFDVENSLSDQDWEIQSFVRNIDFHKEKLDKLQEFLQNHKSKLEILPTYERMQQ